MSKPSKRLLAKDMQQIENRVRLWPIDYRNVAAQLILHARWQKEEIAKLEKEVASLRAPELIKKNTWEPPADPDVRGTLEERIVHAFENGYQTRPSFLESLTRHGKTLVEAELIYRDSKRTE